jgi:hypothetical protein
LRMLQSARGRGIVGHLPLLSAVFPDIAGGEDPLLAAALAAAGEAIRNVYERLFVKVRIPNYDLTSYDLEDGAVRGTLAVLLDEAAAARAATIARADLRVTLERGVLRTARERLTDAPIGAVDAVATIAMLLPRCGDGAPAVALGDYVTLLADELATARTLSHDAFAGYLTTQGIDALDRARDRTIAVLEPVASLV